MELDYTAIKALSSPTRIKILHKLLEKRATPTQLSEKTGKSKSTVSSHLSILEDAGLVEKDKREGRRRVTYTPTRKAKAIVEGRERTVRFSVASSVLSVVIGLTMLGSVLHPSEEYLLSGDDRAFQDEPGAMDVPDEGDADITEAPEDEPGTLDAPEEQDAPTDDVPEEAPDAPAEDTGEAVNALDTVVEVATADTTLTVVGGLLLLAGIVMMAYGSVLWWMSRSADSE